MKALENLTKKLPVIEAKIGYTFKDSFLLTLAFVHRSYVNEHPSIKDHNERLEFLGDSILGLLISDYLYRALPDTAEGVLSNLRSKLVNASACTDYVHKLDVEEHLLLGRGERLNCGRGRDSLLANLFEAIIGAIYLDGGYNAAREFLQRHLSDEITATIQEPQQNSKAVLQDLCQKKFQKAPTYRILQEHGPDHKKQFLVAVYMDDNEMGTGSGPSKKDAQQAAATAALQNICKSEPSVK